MSVLCNVCDRRPLVVVCRIDLNHTHTTVNFFDGHYYELVDDARMWAGANTTAALYNYLGVAGHLATITSQAEHQFLLSIAALGLRFDIMSLCDHIGWIGATDLPTEGTFVWQAGPERGR
jgi:hypothetical protein